MLQLTSKSFFSYLSHRYGAFSGAGSGAVLPRDLGLFGANRRKRKIKREASGNPLLTGFLRFPAVLRATFRHSVQCALGIGSEPLSELIGRITGKPETNLIAAAVDSSSLFNRRFSTASSSLLTAIEPFTPRAR